MIETFRVRNYKALRDVEVTLTPMHVLIGPNDSGKTSILEALGALCRSVDVPLGQAFEGRWSGCELVWNSAQDQVVLEARIPYRGNFLDYSLHCAFNQKEKEVKATREEIRGEVNEELNRGPGDTTAICGEIQGRATMSDAHQAIHAALSGAHVHRWNPRSLALPNAPSGGKQFQMHASGLGLTLLIDDIIDHDRALFQQLEDRFRKTFPRIKSIRLVREDAYEPIHHEGMDFPQFRPGNGKGLRFVFDSDVVVPASQMSDGVLLVLAYLAVLYSPAKPRLLMVEEPENGIHPSRLKEVLGILRELVNEQSHTQILMTTHSPYVLDEFGPEEVTLCEKGPDGAVRVHRLSDVNAVRDQLDVFSLGEIWTAEGDEALARGASNGAGGKQ